MPDSHRVILTAKALSDLEGIARFVQGRSPQNAPVVAETVINAIDSLASMPARFKRVGRSRKHGTAVHAMVNRPFIIYYRVDDHNKSVHVMTVIHGARRQPRRFE